MVISVPTLLAWLVAALAVYMWIVVWEQVAELRERPDNVVNRAIVVATAWMGGLFTIFAFVFWSNDQSPPLLSTLQAQILTRGYMLTGFGVARYFRSLARRAK